MSKAREIINEHKDKSEFMPEWKNPNQWKWFPEYSEDSGLWQVCWTALWDTGINYFSEEEAEELVAELNEKCPEGWE